MAGEHDLVFRAVGTAETAAGVDEVTVKLDDQKKKLSELRAENAALDRAAKQLKSSQETSEGQYQRLLTQTKKLLTSNRIDVTEYEKAIASLDQEVRTSTGRFEKYGEAQRKAERDALAAKEQAASRRAQLDKMMADSQSASIRQHESAELASLRKLEAEQTRIIRKEADEYRKLSAIGAQIRAHQETAETRKRTLIEQATAAREKEIITAKEYSTEIRRINSQFSTMSGEFSQFAVKSEEAFGVKAIKVLGSYAIAKRAVHGVEQLITTELEKQKELRERQQTTVESVSASRSLVVRNLPQTDNATVSRVLKQNEELAKSLKLSETIINSARAQALSASGGDEAASQEAVAVAGRFLRDSPNDIAQAAGTLLDLSRVTNTDNATVNLGLLATIAGQSRVVDPRKAAMTIPSALIGARSFGATTSEAAAIFSALTTGSGDFEGGTSRTATIKLAEVLSQYEIPDPNVQRLVQLHKKKGHRRTKQEIAEDEAELEKATKAAEEAALRRPKATIAEKIAYLQSHPDEAKEWVEGDIGLEKQPLGALRTLMLQPQSRVAQDFRRWVGNIPDNRGLWREGETMLRRLESGELEPIVAEQRTASAIQEQADLMRGRGRFDRISQKVFESATEALMQSGPRGWHSSTAASWMLRGGPQSLTGLPTRQQTINVLQDEINRVRAGTSSTSEENLKQMTKLMWELVKTSQKQEELLRNQRPPGNQVGQGNGMLGGND